MPPRYAYWTILIDDKPTAFRAREREELQPTMVQLQRKNTNVTMRWFARGRLWESREAERDDFQMHKHAAAAPRERRDGRPAESPAGAERRGSDWRPGGAHKDPRDRFKKKNRPERAWSEKDPATQRDRDKPGYAASKPRGDRPRDSSRPGPFGPGEKRSWSGKPPAGDKRPWTGKPRERKPWDKPAGPPSDRPWQTKPTGPRAQRKPWVGKPSGDAPRGDRPWQDKKPGVAQAFPGSPKREGGRPAGGERKPWSGKPVGGPPRGNRPWSAKPDRKPFTPRGPRPGGAPGGGAPRKRRDDEPDKD